MLTGTFPCPKWFSLVSWKKRSIHFGLLLHTQFLIWYSAHVSYSKNICRMNGWLILLLRGHCQSHENTLIELLKRIIQKNNHMDLNNRVTDLILRIKFYMCDSYFLIKHIKWDQPFHVHPIHICTQAHTHTQVHKHVQSNFKVLWKYAKGSPELHLQVGAKVMKLFCKKKGRKEKNGKRTEAEVRTLGSFVKRKMPKIKF